MPWLNENFPIIYIKDSYVDKNTSSVAGILPHGKSHGAQRVKLDVPSETFPKNEHRSFNAAQSQPEKDLGKTKLS